MDSHLKNTPHAKKKKEKKRVFKASGELIKVQNALSKKTTIKQGRNTCKLCPWESFSRDVNEFIFSEQPLLIQQQSDHK